jgi:hypothetical protein
MLAQGQVQEEKAGFAVNMALAPLEFKRHHRIWCKFGALIGGLVGGLAGVAIVVALFLARRRKKDDDEDDALDA